MLVYLIFSASPVLGMLPFMNGNRAVSIEAQGMHEKCHGGLCGGMAHYPAKPGIHYYATFDVPELPEKMDGITYFIYFNIFFGSGPKTGDGRMNQFVPQLMLGNPLCKSSGPPLYKPKWEQHHTWVFGSQYFFELFNETKNATQGHAATGDLVDAKEGEILYTKFELSKDYVWTLTMGVLGDPKRVSTVVSREPFMGLIREQTRSWRESYYDHVNVNSCWELYGMRDRAHYPGSGSRYDMRITTDKPDEIKWDTHWNARLEWSNCSGAPTATISESHNSTTQNVLWNITAAPKNI